MSRVSALRIASDTGMDDELIDLFEAARKDDVEKLASGLKIYDINVTDDNGMTLLHHAAACLSENAVDYLLAQEGIDPTIKDYKGRTASVIPIQTFGDLGEKMANKLGPLCHPPHPDDLADDNTDPGFFDGP